VEVDAIADGGASVLPRAILCRPSAVDSGSFTAPYKIASNLGAGQPSDFTFAPTSKSINREAFAKTIVPPFPTAPFAYRAGAL
jgi:hypothetical protein